MYIIFLIDNDCGMQHLAPSFAFLHQAHNNDENYHNDHNDHNNNNNCRERDNLQDRAIVGSLTKIGTIQIERRKLSKL